MNTYFKPKREKRRASKSAEKSDSENEENIHELSYFLDDRVKLMKEVLKIIKPKKIKTMAPDCIKHLDIGEINSMLLEELLGISNKRLKYIFNGQNLDQDSSSTDPEDEKQPDIISLDDVSEDDFIVEVDGDKSKKKKSSQIKEEPRVSKIKKEKSIQNRKRKDGPLEEENLMSVLELLELQARARAIRSQLMLEATNKNAQTEIKIESDSNINSDSDSVIIEVPASQEIVIESSESDIEQKDKSSTSNTLETVDKNVSADAENPKKKITLIRDRFDKQKAEASCSHSVGDESTKTTKDVATTQSGNDKPKTQEQEPVNDEDEIILIVDQEEMDGLIGE
ncbi:hypothetical protein Zmor_002449 [Zophobas morio]|uniref:Caspase activity and apoptosis inhibitor 1 n=1 Tax=Zophobas morio TaxID=2755281 RepID=A0AA38J6G9_9CUCU|nr:hypothetical protein Zmor_002449 [Zophobas morio]